MLIYTALPTKKRKKKSKKVVEKAPRVRLKPTGYKEPPKYRAPGTDHIPSHQLDDFKSPFATQVRYEGEMAEREAKAQEEIRHKQKCIAPAFNKGNLTYIATEEQAKWVGRK